MDSFDLDYSHGSDAHSGFQVREDVLSSRGDAARTEVERPRCKMVTVKKVGKTGCERGCMGKDLC